MRTMDRYLIVNFLVTYFIVFTTLVSLYVIIDLFANADEFIKDHPTVVVSIERITKYYFLHSFEYFWRLSPIITQVAAMSTLASLHRYNEIIALLAAGVPTRRALAPILAGVAGMLALGVANREFMLPANSDFLQRAHDDVEGKNRLSTNYRFDDDNMLVRSREAIRESQRLEDVKLTFDNQEIQAEAAVFTTDAETKRAGLRLEGLRTLEIRPSEKLKRLSNGEYFVYTELTMERIVRQNTWTIYASTMELLRELERDQSPNPQELRALIHNRLMQPISNMLLVLLGVPFVLTWNRRNVYRSLFISMLLSGCFFVLDGIVTYVAQFGYIDAMFAAWLPVFLFGPIAMALMHRIGT